MFDLHGVRGLSTKHRHVTVLDEQTSYSSLCVAFLRGELNPYFPDQHIFICQTSSDRLLYETHHNVQGTYLETSDVDLFILDS